MKKNIFKAFIACFLIGLVTINTNITYKHGENASFLKSLVNQVNAQSENTGYDCFGKQYWTSKWQLKCDGSDMNTPCRASVPC